MTVLGPTSSADQEAAPPFRIRDKPDQDWRLHTMFQMTRILVTEHDLDEMVQQVLACLVDGMAAADAGLLLFFDAESGTLKVRAAQGYDFEILRDLSIEPGESIAGRTFMSGQALLLSTAEAISSVRSSLRMENVRLLETARFSTRVRRNAISVPLIADGTKVGVLLLETSDPAQRFTGDELAFLEPAIDLLAMAIENARLRDELQNVRSLNEANRLKAEVISTLAHEMRTPLTSIKGFSSALLMEELEFPPETQREFLQTIDEECDVLQDLIRDLLESSIIDAGFLKLEPQPVLARRLAKASIEEVRHLSKSHHFMVDFPLDFPVLYADPLRITQVLRNLLDNAVKYSPSGGLVVIRGEVRGPEAVLSVADQGEGIAPEHLNRLFEKFFRIKSGLGRHVAGTGLGLPIARTIVEGHGGRIWAESQINQGTTFYFTIPLNNDPLVATLAEEED